MNKFLPNEIACGFPGAKSVNIIQPYQQQVVATKATLPAKDIYTPTADVTFDTSKTYYVRDGGGEGTEESPFTYKETTDAEFKKYIVYYEKTTTEAKTLDATIVYERYTDGMWVDMIPDNHGGAYPEMREHKNEIFRTTTYIDGDNSFITRDHALDYWANRETAKYIPACRRLESDKYGESARMFR